jgi:peptidyl-dipeptidase Dcp
MDTATPSNFASGYAVFKWDGEFGMPDYSAVKFDEFAPAFEVAIGEHENEIAEIAGNPAPATIENTLAAFELAGEALHRVSAVFWSFAGANTSDAIQAIERDISPRLARHYSALFANEKLFTRIDELYRNRESLALDAETDRVLEKTWKRFVRAGAALDDADKKRLADINEQLALLGTEFGQGVLADEKEWVLFLADTDLAGLPEFLKNAMAATAADRGREGEFALTLSRSLTEPFLAFSERRDLREKLFRAFIGRGEYAGKTDNNPVVAKTLALRAEKARMLGYETFAAYKLDDTMAKTPDAVMNLLSPVWESAKQKAAADEAELRTIASDAGQNDGIAAWDWRFYAEKLRAKRFSYDDAELKPYLELENIIRAAFDVAGRLFGISFREITGVTAWHPDVRAFEVLNADGSRRGLFMADYFARPSKRSGAWMSGLQSGYRLGGGKAPIIYNVMNFSKPAKGKPALLSLDEARTLFHEFGHALHGLLSDVTWPSVSGTSVARDFVELPSQLYEHWFTTPQILSEHARHYQTGEPMPQELLEKVLAASTFNAGFSTVEFTASALVDMAFHQTVKSPENPIRFEAETLTALGMPDSIAMRHRTPHFLHVFSGDGYSAGYYSYMWSEVLDADAFEAFEESGDPFNPDLAEKLRTHIYAAGGSADPEKLYTAFRGKLPNPDAMMRKRGLV